MSSARFKVVTVGDSSVGKTALVTRMSDEVFNQSYVPTVGSQFVTIPQKIDGRDINMEVWDTAGQEVYRSLVGFYTREAKGAILVFDVTSKPSFESLSHWLSFLEEQAGDAKVIIVGNKVDLEERAVSSSDARQFADARGLMYFETSAKTGQSVVDLFEKMGELLLASSRDRVDMQTEKVELAASGKKQKGCC